LPKNTGKMGGLYETAWVAIDHFIAEKLFDQDQMHYEQSSLLLDYFLLSLVFIPFTFLSLLFALVTYVLKRFEKPGRSSLYHKIHWVMLFLSFLFGIPASICLLVFVAITLSGRAFWLFGSDALGVVLSSLGLFLLLVGMIKVTMFFIRFRPSSIDSDELSVAPLVDTENPEDTGEEPIPMEEFVHEEKLKEKEGEEEEEEEEVKEKEEGPVESEKHGELVEIELRDAEEIIAEKFQQQQQRKKQRKKLKEKPVEVSFCVELVTYGLALFLAIFLSLFFMGMCNNYSPLSYSTSFTRWTGGEICSSSPCFVYLLLPEKDTSTSTRVVFHSPIPIQQPIVKYRLATELHVRDAERKRKEKNMGVFRGEERVGGQGRSSLKKGARASWEEKGAKVIKIQRPYLTRYVYVCDLVNLSPASIYELQAGSEEEGFSTSYLFQTLPPPFLPDIDDQMRVRLIIGGDIGLSQSASTLLHLATSQDPPPDAFVIGGDLAYENAISTCYRRMDKWLLQFTAATQAEGYLIPVVPIVGNHDAGGFARKSFGQEALYFYYFPYPAESSPPSVTDETAENEPVEFELKNETYRLHVIEGARLALYCLDSNHVYSPDGEQRTWFQGVLKERKYDAQGEDYFSFTAYHDPLFPSQMWEYPNEGRMNLRREWLPLMDEYDIDISFEFHTHQYKRSLPIRSAAMSSENGGWGIGEDPSVLIPSSEATEKREGTVFLGDGCMGVVAHGEIELNELPWYLAKAQSKQHFLILDVKPQLKSATVHAIDIHNVDFDRFVLVK